MLLLFLQQILLQVWEETESRHSLFREPNLKKSIFYRQRRYAVVAISAVEYMSIRTEMQHQIGLYWIVGMKLTVVWLVCD
jgi:hypothetical protein